MSALHFSDARVMRVFNNLKVCCSKCGKGASLMIATDVNFRLGSLVDNTLQMFYIIEKIPSSGNLRHKKDRK
jgi:hypothetical protein